MKEGSTPSGGYWTSPLPLPELPLPATVAGDLPCRKCGYNLKTLPSGAVCPECGTAVGISLAKDWLRYSQESWLQELRRGTRLVIAGIVVSLIYESLAHFFVAGLGSFNTELFLTIPGVLILLTGVWMVSRPDPGVGGGTASETWRAWLRILFWCKGAESAALWVYSSLQVVPNVLTAVGAVVSTVLTAGVYFCLLRYLGFLACRIPGEVRERADGLLAYALAATLLASAAMQSIFWFHLTGRVAAFALAIVIWYRLLALITLVLKVMAITFLNRLAGILKDEIAAGV
jgi:hypothetical protein